MQPGNGSAVHSLDRVTDRESVQIGTDCHLGDMEVLGQLGDFGESALFDHGEYLRATRGGGAIAQCGIIAARVAFGEGPGIQLDAVGAAFPSAGHIRIAGIGECSFTYGPGA